MTNYDLKLNRYASDNKLTRKEVEKDIAGWVYEVAEITEGSEKQISWAKDIQITAIDTIGRMVRGNQKHDNWTDDTIAIMDNIVKNIFTHTDAKFYIDNRNDFDWPELIAKNYWDQSETK